MREKECHDWQCFAEIQGKRRHNTQGRPPPASAQKTPCGQSRGPRAHVLWPARLKLFFATLTRALLGSLAQDVPQIWLSIPLSTSLPSSVTHSLSGSPHQLHLPAEVMCSLRSPTSVSKLHRQKAAQAGQRRLLWVAVLHCSSERTAVILLAVWGAACWSHLEEWLVACQLFVVKREGYNMHCYIFCFLILYLYLFLPTLFCFYVLFGLSDSSFAYIFSGL